MSELKDVEAETKKVGTRKKQQTPEELQKSIKVPSLFFSLDVSHGPFVQILTDKVKDLDRLRSDALRQVLLMERKRGCDFLRMWTRVMEQQLYQFTEGYNILNDNRQFWTDLAASRDQLPNDDEALLAAVSAMTAERTFVPLQAAASSNNPQAFQPPPPMNYAPPPSSYPQPSYAPQPYETTYEGGGYPNETYDDLPPPPSEYADTYMPDDDLPPPPPQTDEWVCVCVCVSFSRLLIVPLDRDTGQPLCCPACWRVDRRRRPAWRLVRAAMPCVVRLRRSARR